MILITETGTYLPKKRESNFDSIEKFSIDDDFILNKIGVQKRAIKENDEQCSDFCVQAFNDLSNKKNIDLESIDCCIVVTQNPDYNIPHSSAIVHKKLGLALHCACFDISLGCSGYVYGLSILRSFMNAHNMKKGVLFTSDQYSSIIDGNDKNTALIFGDGATVTLLEKDPLQGLTHISSKFGTKGKSYADLINNNKLHMNGRAIFNFTVSMIPPLITEILNENQLKKEDIDYWYFHQGSKYIIDVITERLGLNRKKVIFDIQEYGNTVSSSIPMLLAQDMNKFMPEQTIILTGFGVGLSWATSIYKFTKS